MKEKIYVSIVFAKLTRMEVKFEAVKVTRTMYGVQKNIQHLCTRNRSKMWGKDAWKKVIYVEYSFHLDKRLTWMAA